MAKRGSRAGTAALRDICKRKHANFHSLCAKRANGHGLEDALRLQLISDLKCLGCLPMYLYLHQIRRSLAVRWQPCKSHFGPELTNRIRAPGNSSAHIWWMILHT